MDALRSMLNGAVATCAMVAALFFLRFWLKTRDSFFLLFAIAFGIYAASQFALGWANTSEYEPFYYLPRLVTFALIVAAVVNMADALGLTVIAECIETEMQARALKEAGCEYGQGYLYGRPAES